MLQTLFLIFIGKKGPADLPYSPLTAMVFSLAIAVVTLLALGGLYPDGLTFNHYLAAIASVAIPILGVDLLLRRKSLANRFVQCITAIYGCTIIFNSVLPILTILGGLGILLMLALFIYLFVVLGRIVAQSLEVKTGQGVLIIIGLNLLANFVNVLLLPDLLVSLTPSLPAPGVDG